jgi:hypothetical protein
MDGVGNEGGAGDDHGLRALLAVRSRHFLTYRLAVRVSQFTVADGGAKTTPWRLLLVCGIALDIGTWFVLRRPARFGFKTRLALDSIDVAIWSLAPYTPAYRYPLAVFAAAPLAIEAGIRRPRSAYLVPSVTFATTTFVRMAAGRPFVPLPFIWLILAAGSGVVLSGYDARLRRQAQREWSRRRSADDRQQHLAGQNSVAMGASSAVDGIEAILPLIDKPEPGSALWQLADGWKSGLCQSTRAEGVDLEAVYLGDALKEWEVDHNRHPDLSSRVAFAPAGGIGTMLLTGTQPLALWDRLGELNLQGHYRVALDDPDSASRPPGGQFHLHVGEHLVAVPVDPMRPPRAYDPGAASFVLMGLLVLGDVTQMHVPFPASVACLTLFLGAAVWSQRRLGDLGRVARPAILALAAAVAVTSTVVISRTAHQFVNPSGAANYSVVSQLDLLAILAAMYRNTVSRRALLLAAAGAGGVIALAWLFHPGVERPTDLMLAMVWPTCAFLTAWKFSSELDRAVALHARDLAVNDSLADDRSFRSGQNLVVDLVRRARDEAYDQLQMLDATLSPTLFRIAQDRLEEVDTRLQNL